MAHTLLILENDNYIKNRSYLLLDGKMDVEDCINQLRTFNERVKKIEKGSLYKFIKEQGTGLTISWGTNQPVSLDYKGPGDESLEASILSFRLFYRNGDGLSPSELASIYKQEFVPKELSDFFQKLRKNLNDFLDSESQLDFDGKKLSHRHIIDIFVYGSLAHLNKKKQIELGNWMSAPIFDKLAQTFFIMSLGVFFKDLFLIRDTNVMLLNVLNRNKSTKIPS